MRRREFLKTAGLATVGAAAMTQTGPAYASDKAPPPNVLFIMTDQQFADAMSCRMGDQYIHTPNMDRLAAEGMLFEQAYSPNPLCMPCRASLFTGRYPHETTIQANAKPEADPLKYDCFGLAFQAAGYDTGYIGKWHLQFSQKKVEEHGFEHMALLKGNGVDDLLAEPMVEFIGRKRDKPFLLVASFSNPHDVCQLARGEKLPSGPIGENPAAEDCPPLLPNHAPPENETDIIEFMRRSYQNSKTFPVGDFDDGQWRQLRWGYYRLIEKVDAEIGKVLDALDISGQADNTLVVFTSDHGDCHGAHHWNQKTVFYEESARVPFILRYPPTVKQATTDKLINIGIDLLPTLCDYTGVPAPADLPGRSLRAIAEGDQPDEWREFVVVQNRLVQGAETDGKYLEPDGRMVRSRRFKYCLYSHGERRESLVDMQQDPGEMVNQAANSRFRQILKQHREYLKEHAAKYGDQTALTMLRATET